MLNNVYDMPLFVKVFAYLLVFIWTLSCRVHKEQLTVVRQDRVWGEKTSFLFILSCIFLIICVYFLLKINKMLKKLKLKQAGRLWLQWEGWVGRIGDWSRDSPTEKHGPLGGRPSHTTTASGSQPGMLEVLENFDR